MRIAILGSTTSTIPPTGQAAIEKIAYYQAVGLAEKGHEVFLYTLSGSNVTHKNVSVIEVGQKNALLGEEKEPENKTYLYGTAYKLRLRLANLTDLLGKLQKFIDSYDVILNNLPDESVLLPFVSLFNKQFYHVMHLPIFPELAKLFKEYDTKLISVSNNQRSAFPELDYVATIYNAVDTDEYAFSQTHKDYLLYLGSIGKNKNPKDAILAAKKSKEKLIIGGRIKDIQYYNTEIAPLINGIDIVWIGEVSPKETVKLYQGAKALLFPTLWEEPFGLVMIEAMSCGTPVIAYPNGAVSEVVKDGLNGFIAHNVSEMAEKIKKVSMISRRTCRDFAVKNFNIGKMVDGYNKLLTEN